MNSNSIFLYKRKLQLKEEKKKNIRNGSEVKLYNTVNFRYIKQN